MYHTREPHNNIRQQFDDKPVDFVTDLTANEIRSSGESQRYGQGGRWKNPNIYLSIGGYASRLGMPFKLQTTDEIIPISPTDAKELKKAGLIRDVQPYKNDGFPTQKKE
jgi:hypothetical protein